MRNALTESIVRFALLEWLQSAAVNPLGEKLPMFVIGKAKNPRCFKNVKALPVGIEARRRAGRMALCSRSGSENLTIKLLLEEDTLFFWLTFVQHIL